MSRLILLLPVILMLSCCKTARVANPGDYTGKQLIFGEGGGFTGRSTHYILLENGQVFKQTIMPESISESESLSKKTTRNIFEKLDSLDIGKFSHDHPGNMTYSIAVKDSTSYRELKWGDPNFPPPVTILEFYQYLREQIPNK